MSNELLNLTKNKAYRVEIYSFSNTPFVDTNGRQSSTISFPAFVTDFTDSYKSSWNEQSVLGKMDPIATFKNTKRTISLAFDVPSESLDEAKNNLAKIDYIIRGQYPIYDNAQYGTAVMSSPPMFRIRFANFVRNASVDNDGNKGTLRTGLLCYFNGFDFKPKNDSGYFVENGENLYPKLITVSFTMNIIHEHPLGKATQTNGIIINRDGFNKFPRFPEKITPTTVNGSDGQKAPTQQQPTNAQQQLESQKAASDIGSS